MPYLDLQNRKSPILTRPVIIFIAFAFVFIFTGYVAAEAVSQYKIALKEKDKIPGTGKGNILVYGRPYVVMYDETGKKLFSKKLKNNVKPTISMSGNYLGLITFADRSPTDLKTVSFRVYNSSGNSLYKIPKPASHSFIIGNNGAVYGIEGVKGISPAKIHFYNHETNPIKSPRFASYRAVLVSPSGERCLIDSGDSLYVFGVNGDRLYSLPRGEKYRFDVNDQYVAWFSGGMFRLYKKDKLLTRIESTENSIIELAVDTEANIVVLMAQKHLEVYDLAEGRLLWEFRLLEKEKLFTSLAISPDGKRIACGIDINLGVDVPKSERHIEGYLYLFSVEGKMVYRHQEKYNRWRKGTPRVDFCNNSGAVLMITGEKIESFLVE